eukprot:CAMPEP_0204902272 /NCGR_PEP_ID=MMETSP1397-20131031/3564_1 /ASSEMBLY_ACC=CAM_ASM_000891 /TAXON_ID=49980 /ORGANISM="Climacostomum Climacostomum virens, Strain Stock W-24" /LENGTH=920 /DNA_ID=CAMNT_0052070747 /DNA_START=2501 /DNA_END=5263 /DNA_ORIENTATION=+
MLRNQQSAMRQTWKQRKIDVSYLRDALSTSPPRNAAYEQVIMKKPETRGLLPTEIGHLRKMLVATDEKRVPKQGEAVVMVSCSRESCFDHNHGKDCTSSYSLGIPAGRQDALNLKEWYENMKHRGLGTEDQKIVDEAAMREIVRQVAVHCQERAELLQDLVTASISTARSDADEAQANAEKAKARFVKLRASMEKNFQDEVGRVKKENDLLVRKLDEADIRATKLQGDLNIARFKIKELEEVVSKHSNDREDWIDRMMEPPQRRITVHDRNPAVQRSKVHFQSRGTKEQHVQATVDTADKACARKLKCSEAETQHEQENGEQEAQTDDLEVCEVGVQTDEPPVSFSLHHSLIAPHSSTPIIKHSFDDDSALVSLEQSKTGFDDFFPLKKPIFGLMIADALEDEEVRVSEEGINDTSLKPLKIDWDVMSPMNGIISVVGATPDYDLSQEPEEEDINKSNPSQSSRFSKLVDRLLILKSDIGDSKDDIRSAVSNNQSKLDMIIQEKEMLLERLQEEIMAKTKKLQEMDYRVSFRRASSVQEFPVEELVNKDYKTGFEEGHAEGFKIGTTTGWERGRIDGIEETVKRDTRNVNKSKSVRDIIRKGTYKLTKVKQFILGNRKDLKGLTSHANLAAKILEKFLTWGPQQIKRTARMTTKMLIKQVTGFYNTAIQRNKNGDLPDGLLELVYDETLQRFGLKAVGEKKFLELLASAHVSSDNATAGLFCKLTGIIQPGYSRLSFKFYINALAYMLNMKIGIAMNDDLERQYYPTARAFECAKEKLQDLALNFSEVFEAIDSISVADPRKINPGGLVELDSSLEILIKFYEEFLSKTAQAISSLIESYRTPPSHLAIDEFTDAVSRISPGKLSIVSIDGEPTEALMEIAVDGNISTEKLIPFCQEKTVLTWYEINNYWPGQAEQEAYN